MDRPQYMQAVISEHLSNPDNYERIPNDQVKSDLDRQRQRFLDIHRQHRHSLPTETEEVCFQRATKDTFLDNTRIPQLYGLCKVHKGTPAMCSVVSCINSVPEIFSKHADKWLKKLLSDILPTFVRDSAHLISELTRNFPHGLPPGAKLFSVNAVGKYSNIDTPHGIEVLTTWLTEFPDDLPEDMPVNFIIDSLTEVMKNNIFQFGDTTWRQLCGCAMGTSTAMNYAYLYVGLLEIRRLLPHFKDHLPFFRRFIDDGFGIWIDLPDNPNAWTNFIRCLNNWGC
jgi:hypothetical protein